MSVFGIVGLILAAIVLLTAALLCVPGRLLVTYDAQNGFQMRAGVLWFDFGGKKPHSEEKKETAADPAQEKKPKPQGGVDLRALKDHAEEVVSLLGQALRRIGKLSRRVRVKELVLTCIAGGDDPAAAAEQYGKTCAVLYPALAALHSHLRVSEECERVTVACDFGGESRFDLRLLMQLRFYYVLRAIAPLILPSLSLVRRLRSGAGAAKRKPRSKA